MITLDWLFTFFDSFGYLGVFTASFVGSIIVFVPVPYFPVLVAAALSEQLDPNLISLVSAIGVLLAKMIIFYASYYGRSILSDKTKQRMYPLQKVLRRYGGLGAFIVALIGAHFHERIEDAAHRALSEAGIAVEHSGDAVAGDDTHHQARAGAGIAEIEHAFRRQQGADAGSLHRDLGPGQWLAGPVVDDRALNLAGGFLGAGNFR